MCLCVYIKMTVKFKNSFLNQRCVIFISTVWQSETLLIRHQRYLKNPDDCTEVEFTVVKSRGSRPWIFLSFKNPGSRPWISSPIFHAIHKQWWKISRFFIGCTFYRAFQKSIPESGFLYRFLLCFYLFDDVFSCKVCCKFFNLFNWKGDIQKHICAIWVSCRKWRQSKLHMRTS